MALTTYSSAAAAAAAKESLKAAWCALEERLVGLWRALALHCIALPLQKAKQSSEAEEILPEQVFFFFLRFIKVDEIPFSYDCDSFVLCLFCLFLSVRHSYPLHN